MVEIKKKVKNTYEWKKNKEKVKKTYEWKKNDVLLVEE